MPTNDQLDEDDVIEAFLEQWEADCLANPRLLGDYPAKRQAFNDWTDSLCKDGRISPELRHEITLPEEELKPCPCCGRHR